MKKQLLQLTFLVLILSSCSTLKQKSFTPEPVVLVYENLEHGKDELFVLANEWMNEAFVDAESVITFRDKESGVVIGKYHFFGSRITSEYGTTDNTVMASIVIRVKDEKARVSITPLGDIRYSTYTSYEGLEGGWSYTEQDAKRDMERLANDFNYFVKSAQLEF